MISKVGPIWNIWLYQFQHMIWLTRARIDSCWKRGKYLSKYKLVWHLNFSKKMLLHPMLTVITIFSVGNLIGNYFDSTFEKKCEMIKQKVMHSVLKIRKEGNSLFYCLLTVFWTRDSLVYGMLSLKDVASLLICSM